MNLSSTPSQMWASTINHAKREERIQSSTRLQPKNRLNTMGQINEDKNEGE